MSLTKAKELRAKRAQLAKQARDLLDAADKENRGLNGEEQKSFDKIHTDIEEMRSQIDRLEKQHELDQELNASQGTTAGRENRNGSDDVAADAGAKEKRTAARNSAFEAYIRYGNEGISPEQRSVLAEMRAGNDPETRALSAVTGAAGGFTVAPAFYAKLTEALKAFGGMRAVAQVIPTETGATLPFPTANDTAQTGAILGENAQAGLQDIAFGQASLGAFMYTSKIVLVPLQLLQDTAFDITSYIAKALATRLGRIQNTHFTIGTGGGAQPTGVVPASALGKTGLAGQTTSVIYDDLVDLEHSVDPAYRQNARFMMHDLSLKAIKKLKDSQGRPLWLPGLAMKEPDTINGYGYVINQDVPTMAANAKSILFGDFSNYVIRDVLGVTVMQLRERYADFAQVGFVAFARADGNLVDAGAHPIAYYANSAT